MNKVRQLKYIAVDGPIGAGKTTLVKMLAEDFGAKIILEPIEKNPFLADFYKDPAKNAFKTQIFFLLNRFQQQKELFQQDLFQPTVICDYSFAKDQIFAEINLDEDEKALYDNIYHSLEAKLPKPDLLIYLKADSDVMMKRIKKRGWDFEQQISEKYLGALIEAYDHYFLHDTTQPVLVVDSTAVDYEKNPQDFEDLKKAIYTHRGGLSYLISR